MEYRMVMFSVIYVCHSVCPQWEGSRVINTWTYSILFTWGLPWPQLQFPTIRDPPGPSLTDMFKHIQLDLITYGNPRHI